MATNFPTSLDSYADQGCASSDMPMDIINALQDAVEALETKVGVDSSAVVTSIDYLLKNAASVNPGHKHHLDAITDVTATASEVNRLAGVTPGTAAANKVVVVDSNLDINFGTGDITATNGTFTGDISAVNATFTNAIVTNALKFNFPDGFMVNGQIVVSVANNDITVALKTAAGTDPSASDPVHVKINGTVRTVTAALSVTKNDGTNWFNSGASILATLAVPYFPYLGWDSSNSLVRIGFGRIPYAQLFSDFSSTTTDERYGAFNTNPGSSDSVTVVGRFLATLSATASFNWSISGTGSVINRPIYESDRMDWTPTLTGWSGTPTVVAKYQVLNRSVVVECSVAGTSNATAATVTLPWSNRSAVSQASLGYAVDSGADAIALYSVQPSGGNSIGTNRINTGTASGANLQVGTFTGSGTKSISPSVRYQI